MYLLVFRVFVRAEHDLRGNFKTSDHFRSLVPTNFYCYVTYKDDLESL